MSLSILKFDYTFATLQRRFNEGVFGITAAVASFVCNSLAQAESMDLPGEPLKQVIKLPSSDVEVGSFTLEELQNLSARNNRGILKPFSSFEGPFKFDYSIVGYKGQDHEQFFKTQVLKTFRLGQEVDPVEGLQQFYNLGDERISSTKYVDPRAAQLTATMVLLGDKNTPLTAKFQTELFKNNLAMDIAPLRRGRIVPLMMQFSAELPIAFKVADEKVALYKLEGFAEGKPTCQVLTDRNIMVFPPDSEGTVQYRIFRTYKKI